MIQDYMKAEKLGEKEYKYCVSKGIYPYLPVLDDLLEHVDVDANLNIGLVEIPMKQIVGTYSSGRTTAFARNFMPILEAGSEFASKWGILYDALMEEGLREPIKAFEYLNKFYVMEGNKRVSVLKSMDAVSIEGYVTRVIPKKDDSLEVKVYYEFLDFYELSGINYLYMSKEGNFKRLLSFVKEDSSTPWEEEDRQDFRAFFSIFEECYNAHYGDKPTLLPGDAVVAYLSIFSYEESKNKNKAELTKDLSKLWYEYQMLAKEEEVNILLNPTEESKKQSLKKKLFSGNGVTKIAFIHDRSTANSSWTYSHELGRKYVQELFGNEIETSCIERVDGSSAEDIIEAAVEAGNKIIFTTSPKLCQASLKVAINHPETHILNCSMSINHKYIRTYYLRMYEGKFISGAIAGTMIESGNIGYLADYPIHGTTAEINAFALGVQMTNPRAKVVLEWTMEKGKDAFEEFRKKNVTLISGRDLNATNEHKMYYGLFKMEEDGSRTSIAMPMRDWGKLYAEIIQSVLCGGYKNDENLSGGQAVSYFWGMSSGAVDVIYSRNLSASGIRLLRNLREGIRDMKVTPFMGPIYDQSGMMRCADGEVISPKEAIHIEWLNENIDGYIPTIEQLKDVGVDLVKVQGVLHEGE